MKEIVITINNKIAAVKDNEQIVNGNSDVRASFVFDGEWEDAGIKTAVFVQSDGSCYYEELKEDSCKVPVLYNSSYVKIGVISEAVCTSTSATVKCLPCVTDDIGGTADDTSYVSFPDIGKLINERVPETDTQGKLFLLSENGKNKWVDANGILNTYTKEELKNILAQMSIGGPEYASSVNEMQDKNKIYLSANGNLWVNTFALTEEKANQFVLSESTLNARISSSGTIDMGADTKGMLVTNFIALPSFTDPYTVRLYNVEYSDSYGYMINAQYYRDDTRLGAVTYGNGKGEYTLENGVGVINMYSANYSTANKVRFSLCIKNRAAITETDLKDFFIELVPKNTTVETEEWIDTGIKYANYALNKDDCDKIVDKILERLDVSYVSSDKVLTVGKYTFRYDGEGIADIGVSD